MSDETGVERYSHFYVNTDDGYPWLTCRQGHPIHLVESGDSLPDLLLAATLHRCAGGSESNEGDQTA